MGDPSSRTRWGRRGAPDSAGSQLSLFLLTFLSCPGDSSHVRLPVEARARESPPIPSPPSPHAPTASRPRGCTPGSLPSPLFRSPAASPACRRPVLSGQRERPWTSHGSWTSRPFPSLCTRSPRAFEKGQPVPVAAPQILSLASGRPPGKGQTR